MKTPRMQLKLREAIDFKKAQGFEVTSRDPVVLMARGAVKIRLELLNDTVVVKSD